MMTSREPSPPSPAGGGSPAQQAGWGDGPISAHRRATARRLRAAETSAEQKLWRGLRRLPLGGSHFRRQVPIGPYVADFACLAARLVIEVDGSGHAMDATVARDAERTAWLEAQGYTVLRFWNPDVLTRLDDVLASIDAAVRSAAVDEDLTLKHSRRRKAAVTPPRRA